MPRNFGLKERTLTPPGAVRETCGPTREARSFILDDKDFIAGLFAGLVLAAGPLFVLAAVLFYLP